MAVLAALLAAFAVGIVLTSSALRTSSESRQPVEPHSDVAERAWLSLLAMLRKQATALERPRLPWEDEPRVIGSTRGANAVFPAVSAPVQAEPPALSRGARWNYRVGFGPVYGNAGELAYESGPAPGDPGPRLRMRWTLAGGTARVWYFGVFAPGHPSHANVRFPGFFMHAAYLLHPMEVGARVRWAFPWSGTGASPRERRFEAVIAGWERVSVPEGQFTDAGLDTTLSYVDGGRSVAEVKCTQWYAPAARQVVRVLWQGKAPDESATARLAELVSLRLP